MRIYNILIETKTPLKVGSGKFDYFNDMPVQKDWNNLPFILGTSIAGVLREKAKEIGMDKFFGEDCFEIFKKEGKSKRFKECVENQRGSRVIVSNALLVGDNGKVNEQLLLKKNEFLKKFENLPIREHTAINEKGIAKEHMKYDEEVVYKGSRFRFSLEFIEMEDSDIEKIVEFLFLETLRFGGGSSKGFGEFEVLEINYEDIEDLSKYSSSLNYIPKNSLEISKIKDKSYDVYVLELKPNDFFIFGSGLGDSEADMIGVYEEVVDYENKKFKTHLVIPASSIKGVISHRLAYYYNLENSLFEEEAKVEEENEAVVDIFGSKKGKSAGSVGKVIIGDIYLDKFISKVFEHVAIDRFLGGAKDGALFQEKANSSDKVKVKIYLRKDAMFKDLFEKVLKDIVSSNLALGGMVTKGYGFFKGEIYKNGEKL